jgi:hypothetical protein
MAVKRRKAIDGGMAPAQELRCARDLCKSRSAEHQLGANRVFFKKNSGPSSQLLQNYLGLDECFKPIANE